MDIDLYVQIMTEIKNRTTSILDILRKKHSTSSSETNVEFMCLQVRKILELISLGSLVVNKETFDEEKIKYQKFWHAERILNDIEKLNPDFYPVPIIEKETTNPEAVRDLVEMREGFLTRKEFIKIYEKCGKIMHADNPFGSKVDRDFYNKNINDWLTKIMLLLNTHKIKLKNDKHFYLIHMQEKNDDLVHAYSFGLVE